MSAQHTPGPWAYVDQEYGHDAVYGADGRLICHVFGDDAQAQEDGRLIAAAPELLLALRSMLNLFEQHEAAARIKSPVGDYARAAISKAAAIPSPQPAPARPKPTPGPLIVKPEAAFCHHNGDIAVVNAKGALIALAYSRPTEGEALTNALLYAAAPELLRLLDAAELLFACRCNDSTAAGWLMDTRAVIAKLTGAAA